ncbi:hypothetical protein [Oxalobacter formigenes]|uniref:hypothetical protein n=1 Tax=Oxalobacter formigenes TaxID=847 RepID=UPI00241EC395|nr:hypothetical protein [Oxalobacter formigenes]
MTGRLVAYPDNHDPNVHFNKASVSSSSIPDILSEIRLAHQKKPGLEKEHFRIWIIRQDCRET